MIVKPYFENMFKEVILNKNVGGIVATKKEYLE